MAQATTSVVSTPTGLACSDGPGDGPSDVLQLERELSTLVRRALHSQVPMPGVAGGSLERAAYQVLVRLLDEGPQRGSDLAAALGLDLSTVSRQVSGLCGLGLVQRTVHTADRRASLLELSVEGRGVVERCRGERRSALGDLLSAWSARDRATLARLLARLNADIQAGTGSAPERTTAGPGR